MAVIDLQYAATLGLESFVSKKFPATNYGGNIECHVGYDAVAKASDNVWRTIIEWNIRAIPPRSLIHPESYLWVQVAAVAGTSGEDFEAWCLTRAPEDASNASWDEQSVTWDNHRTASPWTLAGGDYARPYMTAPMPAGAGGAVILTGHDFTRIIAHAVNETHGVLSLLLRAVDEATASDRFFRFRSSDFGTPAERPRLYIVYTPFVQPTLRRLFVR